MKIQSLIEIGEDQKALDLLAKNSSLRPLHLVFYDDFFKYFQEIKDTNRMKLFLLNALKSKQIGDKIAQLILMIAKSLKDNPVHLDISVELFSMVITHPECRQSIFQSSLDYPIYHQIIFKILSQISESMRTNLIEKLILLYAQKYSLKKIHQLHSTYPMIVNTIIKNLQEPIKTQVSKFLSIDEKLHYYLEKNLDGLTNGLNKTNFSAILLICAEIKARKKRYDFHPTLLVENEFADYLAILKQANQPLDHVFIISGKHWIAGAIEIDTKGFANVVLLDSLVFKDRSEDFAEEVAKVFLENWRIYYPKISRQHAQSGCKIYAIDDAMKLHTAKFYLKESLFTYLARQGTEAGVIFCDLPLIFMRTMQSSKLLTQVIPGRSLEERELKINKKGEQADKSARKHFTTIDELASPRNQRIDYIFAKYPERALNFLLQNSKKAVAQTKKSLLLANISKKLVGLDSL